METCARKVVIVEDEGLIAADLQARLERAGYRVPGVATSGGEALQAIRTHLPDVVLMDIRLAGDLDGIQVAGKVRQDFDIPVVYLTAFEDRETLRRAGETQAFGYIKKPIASASLQGSIEIAISKHRHERYLREQRDWLSASFSAMPDAVLVTDGAGRTCYLNRLAEELTGRKVEAALGCSWTEVLQLAHSDGRPFEDLIPVAILEAGPVSLPADTWLQAGPDRRLAIEGTLGPRWRDGRIEGLVVVFKDATLARFERAQAGLDARLESISRLANGIACQLDFELGVVAEESARLLDALPSDSVLRPAAETIESAASEAFAVTGRLRAFSQSEIEPRVIRVNEVLARLEAAWKTSLPTLTLRLDADARPVHADSRELTRSLDLVLDHVHHRMDAGCSVLVAASRPEMEAMREWVRLRIAYTSTSEDASTVQRLFDPSWDGNWQGLPFAYGLIRRMDGIISVCVEPSHRVVFDIYLPTVMVRAAGAPLEHSEEPAILLVDSNAAARSVLRLYFEDHGYRVLEAAGSTEALSLAANVPGRIALALANLPAHECGETNFVSKLLDRKPETCVRVLEGYRDRPDSGRGPSPYLTKWDLLEWANEARGSADTALSAD